MSEAHLKFIRALPCVICGAEAEAAHVRRNDPRHDKFQALGKKPHDKFTVPLCPEHHRNGLRAQHIIGEDTFWQRHNIDPERLALALHAVTGDNEQGVAIAREASRRFPW